MKNILTIITLTCAFAISAHAESFIENHVARESFIAQCLGAFDNLTCSGGSACKSETVQSARVLGCKIKHFKADSLREADRVVDGKDVRVYSCIAEYDYECFTP